MSTTQYEGPEFHALVYLGVLMYALVVIGLVYVYWDWVFAAAMG
jgi:hypothetical protein